MKTVSKPDTFGIALVLFGAMLLTVLAGVVVYSWLEDDLGIGMGQRIVISIIVVVVGPVYMLVELPKLKSVSIDENEIMMTSILTRVVKRYAISEIDGFKTMTQSTVKGGLVHEILLYRQDRAIQVISSSYIRNFDQLKGAFAKYLKLLGEEKFKVLPYVRDRLKQ